MSLVCDDGMVVRNSNGLGNHKAYVKLHLTRKELEQLYYEQMLTMDEIADTYGVGESTVCRTMEKLGLERRKHTAHIRPILEPSEDLAYVLGVLLGDGYCFEPKNLQTHVIGMECTSKRFVKSFKKALEKIGLNPSFLKPRYRTNTFGKNVFYGVKAHSKVFGEWFLNLTQREIRDNLKTRGMKLAFLRGFYESEGCTYILDKIYGSRAIVMTNSNLELLNLIADLMGYFGYKTSIYKKTTSECHDLWIQGSTERKEVFLGELNPCIKGL